MNRYNSVYITNGMYILAGTVPAGPNLTGHMDPGMTEYMIVFTLGTFNCFTIIWKCLLLSSPCFTVNVCWIALKWSFQEWKQYFTPIIWIEICPDYSDKKINIRYFNPFRLTDPLRRYHIKTETLFYTLWEIHEVLFTK